MKADKKTNPQVQRTRELMLDAAADLLSRGGPEAVTHLHVGEEAGVARATVYRHWPNRADILLDLLHRGASMDFEPPSVDLPIEKRVAEGLLAAAGALGGAAGRTLSAMVGLAEWDAEVSAALEQLTEAGPRLLRQMLAAGVEAGELAADTDVDLLADRLIGPLFLRRLLYHDVLTDAYVERLVAATLSPHLPN
ncbi:MAG: TetR/AcrR family transcriptional regulator [Actinomycetota bacterium]